MMDESGRVPVFVFPSEAEFVLDRTATTDPHPNRKCFTLYNPFNYPVSYKVLCTAAHNYTVTEPDGALREKCYKDIVIRCKQKLPLGTVDKLRFEIRRLGETQIHGQKDILLKSVDKPSSSPEASGSFKQMQTSMSGTDRNITASSSDPRAKEATSSQNNSYWLIILAGVACAAALAVPTIGDPNASNSVVPSYLHLTLQQKLVAAYILGIVTILIVRPST